MRRIVHQVAARRCIMVGQIFKLPRRSLSMEGSKPTPDSLNFDQVLDFTFLGESTDNELTTEILPEHACIQNGAK